MRNVKSSGRPIYNRRQVNNLPHKIRIHEPTSGKPARKPAAGKIEAAEKHLRAADERRWTPIYHLSSIRVYRRSSAAIYSDGFLNTLKIAYPTGLRSCLIK